MPTISGYGHPGELELGPKGFATIQELAESGERFELVACNVPIGRFVVGSWRVETEPMGVPGEQVPGFRRYYVTLVPAP